MSTDDPASGLKSPATGEHRARRRKRAPLRQLPEVHWIGPEPSGDGFTSALLELIGVDTLHQVVEELVKKDLEAAASKEKEREG